MSQIVVDTHVLIWEALTPEKISQPARSVIDAANEGGALIIADISFWEIAMLMQKKRIRVDTDCQTFLNLIVQSNRTIIRSITPAIAAQSTALPTTVNADPADRLIAATAMVEGAPLLTADTNLRQAKMLSTIW